MDECEDIKDLIKRKTKLLKDPHKQNELGDVIFQIGYSYYQKGYYKEALEEFEHALEVRKKLANNMDTASTHRFLGETLCKLGTDFERAKSELDRYYSITLRVNDLVEIQRALTTLGNYFMSLAECNYKDKRIEHLNDAYTHYLKSYDILNDISEKRLVDSKEFGLMKARTCLNCAFAMDEKRDLIICNEYLKTAIEICEANNFHEDLIRCLYIKCDQAKRKGKIEECLKVADRIVEITHKTKDYVQQSQDYTYVADLYIKVQNFEKAKILLKKAYKLKKNCAISPEIIKKLKDVINIIRLESEINQLFSDLKECKENEPDSKNFEKIYLSYEKLGDSYCSIGLYELGLNSYFKQLTYTQKLKKSNSEIAVIYSSIAQTYQDLDNYKDAIKFFELELKTYSIDDESECKSLLNVALLKEKLQVEFNELKEIYMRAYEKAKQTNKIPIQLKVLNLLKETQICCGISFEDTVAKINSLNEINRIRNGQEVDDDEEETEEDEIDENESLVFSSDSDSGDLQSEFNDDERKIGKSSRLRNMAKKSIVKRNLRGETQLHVACIKGNFNMVKKLLEEGHPVNERDNLNWLPIHEACNYGHVKIVEILIKYGTKINDSIGPITPLHDASQNGHLEVVKLLLDAGALCYVFTKEGYTPLDFLFKYKEDNEASLTPVELQLYRECYEKMVTSIKAKDKNYKIKKVVNTEDNLVVDETSLDSEESRSKPDRSYKNRSKVINDLSDFEDDSNDSIDKRKKNKKAISEYRQAINNMGSKSSTGGLMSHLGKKMVDKVLVTESDYNLNDKWLINDLAKSNSNKRKYNIRSDEEESSDDKRPKRGTESISDFDDDEADFINARNKKSSSKKRLVDSQNMCDSSKKKTSSVLISDDSNFDKNCDTMSSDLFETEETNVKPVEIVISNDDSNDSFQTKMDFDTTFKNNRPKHKTQLKLTKMQNYGLKTNTVNKQPDVVMVREEETKIDRPAPIAQSHSSETDMKKNTQNPVVQTWKIKAIIDNRNFLIPIPNINVSIDELTAQILTRYKTIFSKDPSFREPEKVILKSSDDLILFGEDLIKDVLTDMCQVQVLIESYKSAPKLHELYEQTCAKQELNFYVNIKDILRQSEENMNLELNQVFYGSNEMTRQFDLIFETIKLSSKQLVNGQIEYLKNLNKINLSSNCLNDQILIPFFENVFYECSSLKELNLSQNMLTVKSLKLITDLSTSNKSNLKINLSSLEILNLNDNDFGLTLSNGFTNADLANYLNSIIRLLSGLKELYLSDCRINFENCTSNQVERHRDEVSLKNLFLSLKSSQLKRVDVSYNRFGFKNLSDFIENLPEYKTEALNISNCVTTESNEAKEECIFMIRSMKLFVSYSLTEFSIRNLNLDLEQTSELLNSLNMCKQLTLLDISYNEFDPILIKLLFSECSQLEKAYVVNNLNKKLDYGTSWLEIIACKLKDSSNVPLRVLELKSYDQQEINEIRDSFKKRWFKSLVRTKFVSKQIVEFTVV